MCGSNLFEQLWPLGFHSSLETIEPPDKAMQFIINSDMSDLIAMNGNTQGFHQQLTKREPPGTQEKLSRKTAAMCSLMVIV